MLNTALCLAKTVHKLHAGSGKTSDGLIDHRKTISTILEVDSLPLVVHVVHVVNVTVDDWRGHVDKEEHGDGWENQSHEVTRKTDIDHAVALKGAESFPESLVVGGGGKWSLLFAKAWDLEVDTSTELGLDLVSLDHGNNLALLFIGLGIVRANLSEVLREIVFHACLLETLFNNYKLNLIISSLKLIRKQTMVEAKP